MELDSAKPDASPKAVAAEFKGLFGLDRVPKRVECFDVAHISGRGFVAAWSTWIEGHFVGSEYGFRISRESSELKSLAEAVRHRLSQDNAPNMVVLDGGKNQLNAVLNALDEDDKRKPLIVAATKPPEKHSGIAYFLLESESRIDFDESSPGQNVLKILRDEAHDLANRVHRDLRDSGHNYELAAVLPSLNEGERRMVVKTAGSLSKLKSLTAADLRKLFGPKKSKVIYSDLKKYALSPSKEIIPFIVPIRFDDEDGAADDLRPIAMR